MRKSYLLLIIALVSSLLVAPQSASAGGGCTAEKSYFSNNRPKSGETFEAVSKYWINDMPEKWYLNPDYWPIFFIDDEVPEFTVKTKFVEVDSKNLAVFKATVTVPLSIQGNRLFRSIEFNVCDADTFESYGGQEGPTLLIMNDPQRKNSCYFENLDINPRKVNINEEFKVTFDLNFTGVVGEPIVETKYLGQIIKAQATKLQEIGSTRSYEAILKFDKPVKYGQTVFVRSLVPKLCSGLGDREVNSTKVMIGGQEGYISEVIEHGQVTLIPIAGTCSKLGEKTTVFESSTKTIVLTCLNYNGKTLSWVTPEIVARVEAEIAAIKSQACKFGSGMSNSRGKFVCGPRDGGFYYMTEEEFKVAVIKAEEEANAKAKADAEAKVKAEADAKLKAEAEAKAAASKKVTITCVKGKLTKKITGVSPKCPSGYKKK